MASALKTIIQGFDPVKLANDLLKGYIQEQNNRLIAYAQTMIIEIGTKIKSYHKANNMDRTGNLLNSLCWGVSYKGKLLDSGFYREETLRDKGIAGTSASYLHEWFPGDEKYLIPVNGRKLAEEYIQKVGNTGSRGWKVFFAILAPYWGYWEKGFNMNPGFGGSPHFVQFSVMAHIYDQVRNDLKPAKKYYFNVSVPQYEHSKLKEKWGKYSGA